MRLLIVDDDCDYLTACAAVLGADGHDVMVAGSFDEGRRLLAYADIDLLIVDVRLGAYNGLHLLALAPPSVGKVAMSAFADRMLQCEAEQFGGRFVEKPGDYASLTAMLRATASPHRPNHAAEPPAAGEGPGMYVPRSSAGA